MIDFLKSKYFPVVAIIIIGAFGLGAYVGYYSKPENAPSINLNNASVPTSVTADFSSFWKVWQTLDEKYPEASNTSSQDRVYGAIKGLIDSFDDPYTTFFDPEETKLFEEDIAGNFSGVGMEVGMRDKVLTVIAPLKDTPAFRAGILAGDKILKIDDTPTGEMSTEKAVTLIRGEKGTEVSLTIFREGDQEPRVIKVVRDTINIPTLETRLLSDRTFVIELYSFSANSTGLFRQALKEFAEAKTDRMIIDLRGNPGGYLSAAVDIASWFLESGKTVAIEDFGDDQKPKIYRSKGYDVFDEKLKLVILIDGGSASASEIVAGALRDYNIAKLVGEKSYGKGSVQEVVNITPDTIFKVTVAKWLTPNENMIDGKGLAPDFEVKRTKSDVTQDKDPQLDKALEVLSNW